MIGAAGLAGSFRFNRVLIAFQSCLLGVDSVSTDNGSRMEIMPIEPQHYGAVCDIYNHYINNTVITFEYEPIDTAELAGRVEKYTRQFPWLVGVVDTDVVGYVYATSWNARAAYARTVEISAYLAHDQCARGYGRQLYAALLPQLESLGVHTVIAGIAMPNDASVRLQEAFGFVQVGLFQAVGFKHDRWLDVGYWQKRFPGQ